MSRHPRTVRDVNGDPVSYSDVGPIDPAPRHDPGACMDGCWVCARTWTCVASGCNEPVTEGAWCVEHERGRGA